MNDGQILRRTTLLAADRSDAARLQLTAAGLLVAADSAGAALPINNLGAPSSLPMASILALDPAANSGVTIDANDYSYTSMISDGTRWRPKGGVIPLLIRARSDVDRLVVTGAGSFDYIFTVPAWVLELSPQVRVEAKMGASAAVAQATGVRESSFQILVDGNSLMAPGVGLNSLSVSEISVANSGNVKNVQIATKSGTARTGLGASADVVTSLAISNRTWSIVARLLNGAASTAENTLRLDFMTVLAYVG